MKNITRLYLTLLLLTTATPFTIAQSGLQRFDDRTLEYLEAHRTPGQTKAWLLISNTNDYMNLAIPAGLLVAGIIEARSCERFHVLSKHIKDTELAEFYASLFESEARHHTTYTRLAKDFTPDDVVMTRLDELAAAEAEVVMRGEELPRMHS